MKLGAILLSSLRGGGAERELLLLTGELARRGWDLDVILINRIGSAYSASPEINVVSLEASHIRYALVKLAKYLRAAQPEVLLSAETPVNVLAILGKEITGFPRRLIVSEHNHLSMVARHATRLGDSLRPYLARWLYPRTDLVIAVSRGVADDLIRSCKIQPAKVRTIYNMFDIDEIVGKSKIRPEEAWLQNNHLPFIINVGRLTPQKDQATLIRAFAIVRSTRECHLVILGEGTERNRLLQLAQRLGVDDTLYMPGFVANPYSYMRASSVFALSSAWEGLPGALIEALACGTPVVSTDCPSGPAEILESGRYGILAPVGDPRALAEAIMKAMDEPPPGDTLRRRALDFSVERILPEFIAAFQPEGPSRSSPP
jgi:glycosyltransferase involved in cell wall biosynthesis